MSDKDWGTLFPGLSEPIKGELNNYVEAERESRALFRALEGCHTEFQRMKSDESLAELGGQSARQLVNVIREIDGSFEDLPPVFENLTSIFDHHERELRELSVKATEALARANTRWTALEEARTASQGASDALASIDSQIASLRLGDPTDPTVADELADLQGNRYQYVNSSTGASGAVAEAEETFQSSRIEYGKLRQDEEDLVDDTANKLDDIDLNDLKDPNRVLGFLKDVGEWAWDLASGIVINVFKAIEALAEGRFLDALHHLSDALGGVLTVLAIVGVPRPGDSSSLSSGDWSISELSHLTNELSPRAGANHRINSSINSIGDFRTSGPNSTSGSAVFQMAGAS